MQLTNDHPSLSDRVQPSSGTGLFIEDYTQPPIRIERQPITLQWPAVSNRDEKIYCTTPAWTPQCHWKVDHVTNQVNSRFLREWIFPNQKSKQTFLKAGFPRVTCLYFPLALDDRIQYACRLLTLLFLIDDILDDKSLTDGKTYNQILISVSKGEMSPDESDPAQSILLQLWHDMREEDKELTDLVMRPTFRFMQAQTDRARLGMTGLGNYFLYREDDVGKALLSALMCFTMDIHLSETELESLRPLEKNSARQISVVNDIYSWDKELKASIERNQEGAVLCSSVKILMEEAGLDVGAAKRVLWQMVREWEAVHKTFVSDLSTNVRPQISSYIKGLEFQMSGNELWSMTTLRYHEVN